MYNIKLYTEMNILRTKIPWLLSLFSDASTCFLKSCKGDENTLNTKNVPDVSQLWKRKPHIILNNISPKVSKITNIFATSFTIRPGGLAIQSNKTTLSFHLSLSLFLCIHSFVLDINGRHGEEWENFVQLMLKHSMTWH